MVIKTTNPGRVAGLGKEVSIETSASKRGKKRDTVTVVTKSDEHWQTGTYRATHTSRKGTKTTQKGKFSEPLSQPGIAKQVGVVLVEKSKGFIEKGSEAYGGAIEKGGVQLDGYYQGPSFRMDGYGAANPRGLGVEVVLNLSINANAIQGGVGAEKEFHFEVNGEDVAVVVRLGADGQVGLNGQLNLIVDFGKGGVYAFTNADGFAGAKGTLSGSVSVSVNGREGISGVLMVSATAGVGAGAEFEVGLTHFRAKAYASAGVGVGVAMYGTLNASNVARSAAGMAVPGSQGW